MTLMRRVGFAAFAAFLMFTMALPSLLGRGGTGAKATVLAAAPPGPFPVRGPLVASPATAPVAGRTTLWNGIAIPGVTARLRDRGRGSLSPPVQTDLVGRYRFPS